MNTEFRAFPSSRFIPALENNTDALKSEVFKQIFASFSEFTQCFKSEPRLNHHIKGEGLSGVKETHKKREEEEEGETEREMKQSRGSLSVDRSFRAQSINTNLYRTLLLPSSLSFCLSFNAFVDSYTTGSLCTRTRTHTHTDSSWCLRQVNPIVPQREASALSISAPGRAAERSLHLCSSSHSIQKFWISTSLFDPRKDCFYHDLSCFNR